MASDSGQSSSSASGEQPEGLRETIDSTVVAFILAFVFRAFIIEAFVIPTGSMASTLMGAHGTMICRNCGWEYSYGLTDPSAGYPPQVDDKSVTICPNCRWENFTTETNDARRNQEAGDRILVFKWPFDIGGSVLGPQRWNVTVFKDPNDNIMSDGITNYIKRLVGLPNEVLEIIDGDVYAVAVDEISEKSLATLDGLRHVKYLRRTEGPTEREVQRIERGFAGQLGEVLDELSGKLKIQRKSGLAQESLWHVVYDHDYPPQKVSREQPRWEPARANNGWMVGERVLDFDGVGQGKTQAVELLARIDSMACYNVRSFRLPETTDVSDISVRFVVDYRGGEGALGVRLTKRDDVFVGQISSDGVVAILHSTQANPDRFETVATANVAALKPGRQFEMRVQNLDYRVAVLLDGQEVLATSEKDYSPDIQKLRNTRIPASSPPVIQASELELELSHVIVERDVYYLSRVQHAEVPYQTLWGWGTQGHPILLRDGEYFMLGDNSAQSKDSRLWTSPGPHLADRGESFQVGTVPEDQLIGQAFFVYWPSGLRTSLIPFLREVGWIPNVGKMRWIR